MVATVQISHDYPYTAAQVWDVATDLDHLRTVTKGLLEFRDLPNGQIFEGQHIKVQVSLFGKLPFQPYEMMVALLDHSKMTFQSHEIGAGVKFWRHTLRVYSNDMGCRVEETIEINAGILTPIFAVWARFMYRKRHDPRLKILKKQAIVLQPAKPCNVTQKVEIMNTPEITGFHAHVYFDETSIDEAETLCREAADLFGVVMGRVHPKPIGPHPAPSCQLGCSTEQFGKLLPWLITNRGDLTVLCHAMSGDHLIDHTQNAFWLGNQTDLNLTMFK